MNNFKADLASIRSGADSRTVVNWEDKRVAPQMYFPELTIVDEGSEPEPEPDEICRICGNRAWVITGYKQTDMGVVPINTLCPANCESVRRFKVRRLQRLIRAYGDIPENYREFTMQSWAELPAVMRQGKEFAEIIIRHFIDSDQRRFSMLDVWHGEHAAAYFDLQSVELLEPDFSVEPGSGGERPPEWDQRVALETTSGESMILQNSAGSSVMLMGDKGMGKTGLAVAAAYTLAQRGVAAIYVHLPTVLDNVKRTYRADYEGVPFERIIEPLHTADVLIVDEFNLPGKQASEHDVNFVQNHVITPRWNAETASGFCKPMLITTNHTPQSFAVQWGELIASRVFEMFHPVTLGGAVLRRRNAAY